MIRTLSELWKYRALISALVARHLRARYRGSALGFIWSFLNPLCLIAVYSLVFQSYIRFDAGENYPLFLFTGLLPWIWFSSGLLEGTASISSGGSLITKALFPPQILPIVSVLTNLANFLFAVPLLLLFMFYVGAQPGLSVLMLPAVLLIELLFISGIALALSALNVHFRDIQHILGNFLTLWFFLTPIVYPASAVPGKYQISLLLNPVSLFTQIYHGLFLQNVVPSIEILFYVSALSLLSFVIGSLIFNACREGFAELV